MPKSGLEGLQPLAIDCVSINRSIYSAGFSYTLFTVITSFLSGELGGQTIEDPLKRISHLCITGLCESLRLTIPDVNVEST